MASFIKGQVKQACFNLYDKGDSDRYVKNKMKYELLSSYLAFTNDVTKIIHRRKTVTCDHFRTHIYEHKLQSTYPKFILAHKNSHLLVENSRNLTKHFKISPFF